MGQPSYPIFGKTLLSFVSEPGLYKLIMRSDKPIARTFQDWVTRDVLTEKRVGTVTSLGVHEFLRGVSPSAGLHAKTPLSVVSESGLYKLIIRAHPERNAAVRAFQDWVTRDVLPAIRKDGAYVMGEEKVATGEMSEDEFVLKAMGILQGKVERLRVERDEAVRKAQAEAARADVAQAEAETLKPKAEVSRRGLPQRQPGQLRWSAILLGWVPLGLRERGPQFHLPSGQASTPTRRSFQSPAPARRAGRSAACRLPNHLSFGTPSERRPGSRRR